MARKKTKIEMYSTHNDGKSFVAKRFIETLKNKIYKYVNLISKNVYIDKLDVVNKYNNTYHRTIKMEPIDVNLNICIDFNKENNNKGPKYKIGYHERTSKYKDIFANGYAPNCSEEVFVIKNVKNAGSRIYFISDFNGEEIDEMFYEKQITKNKSKRVYSWKSNKKKRWWTVG